MATKHTKKKLYILIISDNKRGKNKRENKFVYKFY